MFARVFKLWNLLVFCYLLLRKMILRRRHVYSSICGIFAVVCVVFTLFNLINVGLVIVYPMARSDGNVIGHKLNNSATHILKEGQAELRIQPPKSEGDAIVYMPDSPATNKLASDQAEHRLEPPKSEENAIGNMLNNSASNRLTAYQAEIKPQPPRTEENVTTVQSNQSATDILTPGKAGEPKQPSQKKPGLAQAPTTKEGRLEVMYNLSVVEQKTKEYLFTSKCSKTSINYYVGRQLMNKGPTEEAKLIKYFPDIQNGHYAPKDCVPDDKLAIIIPFRDRLKHLYTLLPVLFTMLIRQGQEFTIFVVEQDLPTSFNKGVVYNAGFLEALKVGDFNCFIFHDVDMLPLSDLNMYRCDPRGPLHFVAGVNKFKYQLLYGWLIGGVVGFTRQQFQKVNGFSNLYFGWGSEDDDMRLRIFSTNMTMYRRPSKVGLFDMIRHNRDKRWRPNPGRFKITRMAPFRTQVDGINSVKYTLTQLEKKPLFVHVRIALNVTEIYNTAPGYMKDVLAAARTSDINNRVKEGTMY